MFAIVNPDLAVLGPPFAINPKGIQICSSLLSHEESRCYGTCIITTSQTRLSPNFIHHLTRHPRYTMTSTTDISCLPPEILRLCWSYITDREDVCSLVLVSRQFREMCQPMLFRSFTVDLGYPAVQGDGEEKRGILQRKLVRLQGLQKDARLGKMVRQCYFSAREGHLYTHLEVIQIWVTLLPTFAGLTSLTLDRLSLDGVVCRHLSTLVHLSFLSINGC
ncbi:hypothetical protein WG66_013962, partial [Moniliophthora roreri]